MPDANRVHDGRVEAVFPPGRAGGERLLQTHENLGRSRHAQVSRALGEGRRDVLAQIPDLAPGVFHLLGGHAGAFVAVALMAAHLDLEVDDVLPDVARAIAESVGLGIAGLQPLEVVLEVGHVGLEPPEVLGDGFVPRGGTRCSPARRTAAVEKRMSARFIRGTSLLP